MPREEGHTRPYVSIDIETTGLDPSWCQTLEIGFVLDDWQRPFHEAPKFHCYVAHRRIQGEPFALSMHGTILRRIADYNQWADQSPCQRDTTPRPHEEFMFCEPEYVVANLTNWLARHGQTGTILPAGKNFASFDKQFLAKLPHAERLRFHHRTIDPCMLYWNPLTDVVPPDSKQCMERSGQQGEVAHTALEDALSVAQMIRVARQLKINQLGQSEHTRHAQPVR